jgi:chorismate synthase
MGVIAEAVVAFEIARALCEKLGGDSLTEMRRNFKGYLTQVGRT